MNIPIFRTGKSGSERERFLLLAEDNYEVDFDILMVGTGLIPFIEFLKINPGELF